MTGGVTVLRFQDRDIYDWPSLHAFTGRVVPKELLFGTEPQK